MLVYEEITHESPHQLLLGMACRETGTTYQSGAGGGELTNCGRTVNYPYEPAIYPFLR